MNMNQMALEMRKALQMYIGTLDPDTDQEKILSIPSVFPTYEVGMQYKSKYVFSCGVNEVGDPQLYQVIQEHTSASEWPPDESPSLYKKIGVTKEGYPQWVQPLGASDSYNTGDIVDYKGKLYRSTIDGNVWEPGVYGWAEIVNE